MIMTKRVRFYQRDLTTAVKALKKEGKNVARVMLSPDGKVLIDVGEANMVELPPHDRIKEFYQRCQE
jgi:hypothetical protein